MVQIVVQAWEQLSKLPVERQQELARLLLSEMEQDEKWEQTSATHEAALGKLVAQVLENDGRGLCEPLVSEQL